MKKRELKELYDNLTRTMDAKNLADLEDRRPDVVRAVRELVEAEQTPSQIGRSIRLTNPQMWVESKFAESVARALLREIE